MIGDVCAPELLGATTVVPQRVAAFRSWAAAPVSWRKVEEAGVPVLGSSVPSARWCPAPTPLHGRLPLFLLLSFPSQAVQWIRVFPHGGGQRARCALYMGALGFESSHGWQGCRGEDAWFPSAAANMTRAAPWVRPRARYGAAPSPDFPSQTSRGRKGHRVRLMSGSRASVKKREEA
jgi:hypothetical protein